MGTSFGSNATQNMKVEGFQNKLEMHTGAYAFKSHKKETKPFFIPGKDVSFVNGTPNMNDDIQKRYNQSNYRTNELPFEQQKIARGVGQSYNDKGKGGFHQFEINELAKPKNVDQLRALNNQKITYKGKVVSGKGIDKRSFDVNVKKYRPDKFYLNTPSLF